MAALDWIVGNAAMGLRRLDRPRSRTIAGIFKSAAMDGRSGLASRKRGNGPEASGQAAIRTIARANGAPYEVRTRVPALRGRCPGPLDEGSVLGIAELRSITNR